MNVSIEPKLKNALKELIQIADVPLSPDAIIREFNKPHKDKTSAKKLAQIIKNLAKNNAAAPKLFDDFEKNSKKYRPNECLRKFLQTYVDTKTMRHSDSTTVMTPSLCSTQIEDQQPTSPTIILDIKKRVTQAVTEGLSSSAQSSSLPGEQLTNFSATAFKTFDTTRKHSLWFFNSFDHKAFQENKIGAVPIANQEQILVTELLYCLIGISGTYIVPEELINDRFVPIRFKISDQIDVSLRDIVVEILPLASHYTLITKFTQYTSLVCGQILQAFSAALREYIQHYYVSIVQLETEHLKKSLTLHKLLYFLRPITSTMDILANVVTDIWNLKINGGKVLTLLYDKIIALTGDTKSQNILIHLTEQASIPYIEMLELWISKGVVIPNEPPEFFIEDNDTLCQNLNINHCSADYWEKRYTLRRDRVPRFLEQVADIILRTGKYLNVIRQCSNSLLPSSKLQQLHFSPTNQEYLTVIKSGYNYASKTLLEMLVKEKDLIGHLMALKRYFLLYQGDIIGHFMDAGEDELMQNVDKIRPMKLENLLGLTLRTSSSKHDPYKDNIRMNIFTFDLMKQMSQIHLAGTKEDPDHHTTIENIDLNGIECFSLSYEVEWPVSLILNNYALSEYQMIFRQLFFCKHVERQLCKVWIENKNFKILAKEAELNRYTFSLRQRMMCVIQNILYYVMVEVIEPMWHDFIEKLKKVENVDDLLGVHQDFLDVCIHNCLLKNTDLLCTIISLCHVCLEFCKFLLGNESSDLSPIIYHKKIQDFDDSFTKLVIGLLQAINHLSHENSSGKFTNLVKRINFNSFYTDQLEMQATKNGSHIEIDEFY